MFSHKHTHAHAGCSVSRGAGAATTVESGLKGFTGRWALVWSQTHDFSPEPIESNYAPSPALEMSHKRA